MACRDRRVEHQRFADPGPFSIHTIWPSDNHEVGHLYASLFGSPAALLSEGLAVAKQIYGLGTPTDTAARVQQALESVYGRSLADLEHGWWTMLDGGR
jgi:hypothetical protein